MDNFAGVLTALSQAKTPLAVCGIIAAIIITVIWQVAKPANLSQKTSSTIVIGGYLLAALALVLGLIGFIWAPAAAPQPVTTASTTPAPPAKPTTAAVVGTIYSDPQDTNGIANATVVIEPDVSMPRQVLTTDSNGDFTASFNGLDGTITAHMWASANGYQKSSTQLIAIDPTIAHAQRLRLALQQASTVPVAVHPVTNTRPIITLNLTPVKFAGHVITAQLPPPKAPGSWNEVFLAVRGDELKLANSASDAFRAGEYDVAIKFLTQAGAVSSSGVWKSSYPTYAASYYLTGQPAEGKATLAKMIAAIKTDIASGYGYLGSKTTTGFVLKDLTDVRSKVPPAAVPDIDDAITQVTALRAQARD